MTQSNKLIAAKRVAIAVAAVCASLSAPVYANDSKALLDLMLKKGVITQKDYDEFVEATKDQAENKAFREQRIDQDVSKAVKFLQKNADAGQVMKSGIGIQSADGENTIQLSGRIHMDYRNYGHTLASGNTTDPLQDALEVRRARLGVRGQFQKDWKYEIVGNYGMGSNGMSSGSTEIDVAYIDYAANPMASVRMGKFKMPFSLEQLTSSNNIDFMERSLVGQADTELIPGKETGVMLFGSPAPGAHYGLALSTGRGNNNAVNDKPDVIARGTVNAHKYFSNSDAMITHFGIAYSKGELSGVTPASARTETRASSAFFQSSSALTGPVNRTRAGLEAAVAVDAFKVQGEFFDYDYEGANRTDKLKGYYAQAVYNLTGEKHNYSNSSGTFGWIKPNQPFSLAKGGMGAWQVGLRFSKFDASDIAVAAGKTNEADSTTVGLTWFVNDFTRFMLNYVTTDFNGQAVGSSGSRITKDRAVMLRAQVSF
ncbi:MAG: OprO/OprP family phosphate-selective porin [Burkholderiaceae bacterium]|nr:OprO/OprP family phosphate-selective porin [Burkholderiaceae bacterium]